MAEALSFDALIRSGAGDPAPVERFAASDGVELALRGYPPANPRAALLFYHGGGAHSAAGYAHLAAGLRNSGVAVYTPDLRGHGASRGPRGDAPSAEQLWEDVRLLVEHLRRRHPSLPLFAGGHSSGAGLVLNYASWPLRSPVDGYVFLSPQLGFRSRTARETEAGRERRPFARVSTAPFVLNALSRGRLAGHVPAVRLAYPPELLAADPGMVATYTVNLANGLTPRAPREQLAALDRPYGLWVGAADELFDPEKLVAFARSAKPVLEPSLVSIVPGQTHLGILVTAHEVVGPWLQRQLGSQPGLPLSDAPVAQRNEG